MADRETTGTGGPKQNQNQTGNNPTTKGPSEPMSRTSTTTGTADTNRTGTQDTVAGMKQNLGRATGDAADAAMDAGRQTATAAQGRIRSLLEQQTDRAADQLGGVANALHKAAEQLDAENNGAVAQYAVQAADRVERVADMLRHSSLDDIVHEVESFARRQPEVFIGAAFAVGFLAARFIKSSGERRMHDQKAGSRTSGMGTAQSRAAATAAPAPRQTSDYRSGGASDRAMAGGIADSALRTPRRAGDTTGSMSTGTGTNAGTLDTGTAGAPKPTIGMPLARAPGSVTGHATPSTSSTATSATSAGTTAGSPPNSILGSAPTAGTTGGAGSSTTVKPQGQRP